MASLPGKSSNRLLDPEASEQLFQTLEEWNDHLERYPLIYSDAGTGSAARVQRDSTSSADQHMDK